MTNQTQTRRLGDLYPHLGLVGDHSSQAEIAIARIGAAESAEAGDLVFLAQDLYLPALVSRKPAAVVVSEALWERASAALQLPLLKSRDAMLAFAKASALFSSESAAAPGRHPTAQVDASAEVHATASLGPFVVVGPGAKVGAKAVLHGGVQVGPRSKVGEGTILFPHVVLYQDVILGARVRVHANSVIGADGFGYVPERVGAGVRHVKIHHFGGVRVGDDTEIGAGTTIDRGTAGDTEIGRGCIIDNQVQIAHNVHLGEGVVVCGSSGIAGSARLERFSVLGGLSAVNNKVTIGAGAKVAGASAVWSDVPAGATYGGSPAMPKGDFNRLQVMLRRLPGLFKDLKEQRRS